VNGPLLNRLGADGENLLKILGKGDQLRGGFSRVDVRGFGRGTFGVCLIFMGGCGLFRFMGSASASGENP
jgi:hypothetical protein